MTSAGVTASQQTDAAGDPPGARVRTVHAERGTAPLRDAVEVALSRRARRQGLWLMIASSAVMLALIVGIWLSFR